MKKKFSPKLTKVTAATALQREKMKEIQDVLYNAGSTVLQSPEFGWDLKDVADLLFVDTEITSDGRIRSEVRAELSYEEMIYLLREMEKVLKKYDRKSYFDMVEPGIAEAFVEPEPRKTDDLMRQAIRVLYEMDDYVLSVYDNEGWLMNGVPDGEFTESSADEAEKRFEEHAYLIEDIDGRFDVDEFSDFLECFKRVTKDSEDYDQAVRKELIQKAIAILNKMKQSVMSATNACNIGAAPSTVKSATYLFPKFTPEDRSVARRDYGLEIVSEGPSGSLARGTHGDIKRFADEYLGYELNPEYFYLDDEEDEDEAYIEGSTDAASTARAEEAKNWPDYGGAYDVDLHQYFTKEDLLEFSDAVVEHLNSMLNRSFKVMDVDMLSPKRLHIEVSSDDDNEWAEDNIVIDMRRIRIPSDLISRYAEQCAQKLADQLEAEVN